MNDSIEVVEVTPDNVEKYGFCTFYNNPRKEQFQNKLKWFSSCYRQGLKYKAVYSQTHKETIGIIEYVPGEYSWRAVDAKNYMVIHCLIVKKKYSGRGYGSLLINECFKDAQARNMDGVVALATKKPWCANNKIYLKNGFIIACKDTFGFELLVKQIKDAAMPSFGNLEEKARRYGNGVYMLYSDQCPYMSGGHSFYFKKGVLESEYGIDAHVIELQDCKEAQMNPCVWGAYGIIANGKVISYVTGGNSYIKSLERLKIIHRPK
jgi:GNAT superfamily N-acetyltransferase